MVGWNLPKRNPKRSTPTEIDRLAVALTVIFTRPCKFSGVFLRINVAKGMLITISMRPTNAKMMMYKATLMLTEKMLKEMRERAANKVQNVNPIFEILGSFCVIVLDNDKSKLPRIIPKLMAAWIIPYCVLDTFKTLTVM